MIHVLVTGGAGFIGSHFILNWLKQSDDTMINVDKLTYAGDLQNLSALKNDRRLVFYQLDLLEEKKIYDVLMKYQPRFVVNFAAESHVDRSIMGPADFIKTNIVGTFHLLEASKAYWSHLSDADKHHFRFLHVSTDEVYGTLGADDPAFTELHRYEPNSPYSASKAASDHLVRAYHHTYGLPVLTTNCSNNYGPHQFPEKLIPSIIMRAIAGEPLTIYGDGLQIRDWLYVGDHVDAIRLVLEQGRLGETYNIGGNTEKNNLEIVNLICTLLDELKPRVDGLSYQSQITFVADRPGHDRRYAINASKIERELGWTPKTVFEQGMRATVEWYLRNQ